MMVMFLQNKYLLLSVVQILKYRDTLLAIFWFRWMASQSFSPRFSFFDSSNTMSLPLPPILLRAFSIVQTNLAMISPERVVDYMSNSLALRADHARFFLCILAGMTIFF